MKKLIGLLLLVAGALAGYYFYGMKPPSNVADALMSYDRAKFANMQDYYVGLAGAGLVFLLGVFFSFKK